MDTTSRGRRVRWSQHAIERLVCSLAGIDGAAAHIAANGSISSIVLTPAAGIAEHQIIQNVTSALLAGLGIVLDPARVVLSSSSAPPAAPAPPADRAGDGAGQPPSLVERSDQGEAVRGGNAVAGTQRDRARPGDYFTDVKAGSAPRAEVSADANGNGGPPARARVRGDTGSRFATGSRSNALSVRQDAALFGHRATNRPPSHRFERQPDDSAPIRPPRQLGRAEDAGPPEAATSRNGDPARLAVHHNDEQSAASLDGANGESPTAPRIELVELQRLDTQLRCRVVIALADNRFIAIAEGANIPGAEVDLPARAAADALRTARIPAAPIQLEGAVLTDIGGLRHVVASLRIWTGDSFEPAAGAAPVKRSVAEGAAAAVLHAATTRTSRSANT